MGRHDVERHISKAMHQASVKAAIDTEFSTIEKVMRAEVKVATLLVQHNIPLPLADELTPLFRDVFLTVRLPKTILQRARKQRALSMVLLHLIFSSVLLNA